MFGELAPKIPGKFNFNKVVWVPGSGIGSGVGGDGTSIATGAYSLAYGNNLNGAITSASGLTSFAFGYNTVAAANYSISMGVQNTVQSGCTYGVAIGYGNLITSSSTNSVVIGTSNTVGAGCNYSFAFGQSCNINDVTTGCMAFGKGASPQYNGSCIFQDTAGHTNYDSVSNQWVSTFTGGYSYYIGTTLAVNVDTNFNMTVNNYISGYTTTATAAATTTLTNKSTQQQYFTGSTTQTVVLPVASTLALGFSFQIVNNSTGVVTVQSSGANNIVAMAAGTVSVFTCILTSGTTAASWNYTNSLNTGAYLPLAGGTMTGNITMGAHNIGFNSTNGILDANGNNVLTFQTIASSVNYLQINNAGTGAALGINSFGTDSNIILSLAGKGTGQCQIHGISGGGNVSAGYVGEFVSSVILNGSAVTATVNASQDVTSINLTAGDWDVYGNVSLSSVGTSWTALLAWTSTSSATVPDKALYSGIITTGTISAGTGKNAPFQRISIASTTTVYLSCYTGGTSGNGTVCGGIYARRAC